MGGIKTKLKKNGKMQVEHLLIDRLSLVSYYSFNIWTYSGPDVCNFINIWNTIFMSDRA